MLAAVVAGGSLVSLLIGLLVLAVVVYVAKLIIDMLPLPGTIKQIAWIIIGVIFLLILLGYVFGGGAAVAPAV